MANSVFKDTPESIVATSPGTLTGYKAASFYAVSNDAVVGSMTMLNGMTVEFSTNKNTGLNDIDYNPGTGILYISIVR